MKKEARKKFAGTAKDAVHTAARDHVAVNEKNTESEANTA
jgi:hypothetical protein